MPSKQFEHLQESTRVRLAERIPAGCPLVVTRPPGGGFTAWTLDERSRITGRAQVVAAWIDGYVTAWRRTRPPSPEDAIEQLRTVRAAIDRAREGLMPRLRLLDDRTGFEVQSRMCKSCIYRPDSTLNLPQLEAAVADTHMQGFFSGYRACHHAPDRRGVCCRGFWDRHKDKFTLGQLAQRLGLVRFVRVDRFATPKPRQ